MKQILTLSFISLLFLSCQPKDLPTVSDIHPDFAEVKFSHMTTKGEMTKIKEELKSISNIDFDYSQCQFLEDGRLQILKIQATIPNGSRGSTSADLMTLQFNYFGFMYNPKGNPSLKFGEMTEK